MTKMEAMDDQSTVKYNDLIQFLADHMPAGISQHKAWQIERINHGTNNTVYRAKDEKQDLAIKFMKRDNRNRAERQFDGLRFLETQGFAGSPKALMADSVRFSTPVIVEEWFNGDILTPPDSDDEWERLLNYYRGLHDIDVSSALSKLRPYAVGILNSETAKERIRQALQRPTLADRTTEMANVVDKAMSMDFEGSGLRSFCRCDPCIANFIRGKDGSIKSVDWENSGWGDPVLEIADLVVHPSYSATDLRTVIDKTIAFYFTDVDKEFIDVLEHYVVLRLVWWTAVFSTMAEKKDMYETYLSKCNDVI